MQLAVEPCLFDIIEVGIFIGIIKPIPGDADPALTRRRQVKRLYMMVFRGQIPHSRIGKRLFFEKTEIEAWLRKKRVALH